MTHFHGNLINKYPAIEFMNRNEQGQPLSEVTAADRSAIHTHVSVVPQGLDRVSHTDHATVHYGNP